SHKGDAPCSDEFFDPPLLDRLGISSGSLHLNPYGQPIGGQCDVEIRQPLLLEGAALNLHDLGAGPPLFQVADSFLGNARLQLLSSGHLLLTPLFPAGSLLGTSLSFPARLRFLFFLLLFLLIFLFILVVFFVFFFVVLLILFIIVFFFFVVFFVFLLFVILLVLFFVVFWLLFLL